MRLRSNLHTSICYFDYGILSSFYKHLFIVQCSLMDTNYSLHLSLFKEFKIRCSELNNVVLVPYAVYQCTVCIIIILLYLFFITRDTGKGGV